MAITPDKNAIEAAGLEFVEPHEIVADTGPKALNLLAQAVVDIQAKPSAAKPTIITSSTFSITEAGDYVAGVDTTVTLDNGQSLSMQRGQAIVAVDVSGQLLYSDFITLAGPKPPTLTPGTLSATATQTEITATVTGAKDTESGLHAAPYRFSRDGGASWTPWQAGSSYTFTGLTAGVSYNLRAEVRNVAGDVAQLSLTKPTAEDPNAWGTLYFDDFNDAPDGDLAGRKFGVTTWQSGTVAGGMLPGKQFGAAKWITSMPQRRFIFSCKVKPDWHTGVGVSLAFGWGGKRNMWDDPFDLYTVGCGYDSTPKLAHVTNAKGQDRADVANTTTVLAEGTKTNMKSDVWNDVAIQVTPEGVVTVSSNGSEFLNYTIPDYIPVESAPMRIVVSEFGFVDDVAIRAE